jgi:PIN domain nuclease of toxin-antitoxin system
MGRTRVRLLLDTHVLIWLLGNPARVESRALDAVRDVENQLFVSAISPFEVSTKHRIGKFADGERLLAGYDDFVKTLGAAELAMTGHHGIVAGALKWDHRDPFDRILAAQSVTESMTLVTSDAAFDNIAGVRTLWR